jgi:hypothetical protein
MKSAQFSPERRERYFDNVRKALGSAFELTYFPVRTTNHTPKDQ